MKYAGQTLSLYFKNYKQVRKDIAEKKFNEGIEILLHPCNMAFVNPWQAPMHCDNKADYTFQQLVNNFQWYNCCNGFGSYAHFFIEC